jgi:tetratricopeptide (TPR) repeat protein
MAKNHNDEELKAIDKAQHEDMRFLALELSQRYVARYPDDVEGLWLNGISLDNLGRNAEAKEQLEAVGPRLSEGFLGETYSLLARICKEMGNLAQAERYYSKAIDVDSEQSDNYVELGSFLWDLNRIAETEQVILKGIKADASPIADLWFFLGELLRCKGEIIKSGDAFRRVLENRDDEEADTAIEDLKKTAVLKGIVFPSPKSSFKDELKSNDEEEEPGHITANIKRQFFAEIAAGQKKIEYRDASDTWVKKIIKAGAPPFHLRLINGMTKQAPELTVVVEKVLRNVWAGVNGEYELHLGEVIDLQNWDREIEAPMK